MKLRQDDVPEWLRTLGALGANSAQALPAGHPAIPSHSKTPNPARVAVAKASGDNAFTVAEIHKRAAQLAGKPVTVAARIVKVTPNVLGRSWPVRILARRNSEICNHYLKFKKCVIRPLVF